VSAALLTDDLRKLLVRVSDEAQAAEALEGVGLDADTARAVVREWQSERARAAGVTEALPGLALDLDAPAAAPDWIVHGVIERGTVAILAGDTGAAKSIVSQWLAVQGLQGRAWFDKPTNIERVVYIDEENPDRLVTARLRAMGLQRADADRLRYVSRHGVTLGREASDAALRVTIEEVRPDLVVIDTLMSASAVDVNDNVAAVEMMKAMRGTPATTVAPCSCCTTSASSARTDRRPGPRSRPSARASGSGRRTRS